MKIETTTAAQRRDCVVVSVGNVLSQATSNPDSVNSKIAYELPINERVRTLLRLEFLFAQAYASLESPSMWDSRSTMLTILDIQAVFGRSDIKSDLLKELERLASVLEAMVSNPNVDGSKLTTLLDDIDSYIDKLHSVSGPIGTGLKQNELLNAVRQRSSIPGGACDFDLPSYHFWLAQPAERRLADLKDWLSPFSAARGATRLILNLIRDGTPATSLVAENGFFQQSLESSAPYHMVRVIVPASCRYYAEMSGGKHRFSLRFLELKMAEKDSMAREDVPFELACCSL